MNLAGKVVAITGGFGQLGIAIVQAALAAGAKVAAVDVGASPTDPSALGDALALGGVDLAEPAAAARALETVAAKLGGLDALVNVAGMFRWQTLEQGNVDTWDLLYRVNLRTAVSASGAALPLLLHAGSGRIVNVGAAAAAAKAGTGMSARLAGVSMMLGSTALTVMPRSLSSSASDSVSFRTPALAAV